MYQRTTKVDTTDLGDSARQGRLETLAKLLEAGGLVERGQLVVMGKPGVDCSSGK